MDQIYRDKQLLERLRQDDQVAWREVYDGNRSKVVNYLRRYSVPETLAVEIYQDTLVFLDERKHSLQLESQLSTYLIGVAYNKLRSFWKANTANNAKFLNEDFESRLARVNASDVTDDELKLAPIELADEISFGAETVEADAMIQQALTQVQLKHCADLFRMVYYEGIDQRQVADILKLSYGSVRNQLRDCKRKMKTILLNMGWGQ